MKYLAIAAIALLPLQGFARDPGTGSNTTVGPGPATPDAGPAATSVMGGGTPGNQGINTIDIKEPNQKERKIMHQEREEAPSDYRDEEVTDQDPGLNTIQGL